jgi:hypothetical protein
MHKLSFDLLQAVVFNTTRDDSSAFAKVPGFRVNALHDKRLYRDVNGRLLAAYNTLCDSCNTQSRHIDSLNVEIRGR